jgi:tetratricopeptide (TPR) repeat protein
MTVHAGHCRARRAWRFALSISLVAAAPAFAQAPATAGPARSVLQAEEHAARAFEAYGRKDYAEAVALYRMAYDAAPSADALYNIARVYDIGLRDRPLAIAAYRRYLADPGANPDQMRVANTRLAALREAELAVSPSSPAPARDSARPAPRASAAEDSASDSTRPWSSAQIAGVIVGATGVVGLGAGIGFGLLVLKDAETANELCVDNRCRSQRGVDAARAASTHATVATVGISAGLGLLATGAALWLASGGSREEPLSGALRMAPLTGRSELGLQLSGGW